MKKKKKIVFVGISGGVDSSVAAKLLLEQGYNVVAVHMRHLESTKDVKTAKKVAKQLEIPLEVIDMRKEFRELVIDRFLNDYKNGLTPNPCVICNKNIKFGLLMGKALAEYAKNSLNTLSEDWFIATGHYARINQGKILKGIDKTKDQTYFLNQIDSDIIPRIIFPLGHLTKDKVKKNAVENNLIAADREESQDVCFISSYDSTFEFLKNEIGIKKGDIIEKESGKVIGEHNGQWFFTKGQRKGIGVSGSFPYYVVDKQDNNVYVAMNKKNQFLKSRNVKVKNFNYVGFDEAQLVNLNGLTGKVRYGMPSRKIKKFEINKDKNCEIIFNDEIWATTPGQYAVIYKNDILVGGGEIINQ